MQEVKEGFELLRVISSRISVLKKDQECAFCRRELYEGTTAYPFGVVDRLNRSWERVYLCDLHKGLLETPNPEDHDELLQDWLIDSGYCNEKYRRD